MLKKLLPKLIQNLQKLLTKTPLKKDQSPQQPKNLSPNLLVPVEKVNLIIKASPKIISLTSFLVVSVSLLFVIFLISNYFLDKKLEKLKETRDGSILVIDMKSGVEKEARAIVNIINLYKKVTSENKDMAPGLEVIVKNFGENITLESLTFKKEPNVYEAETSTTVLTNYAYFINSLLENNLIESISLNSVELNSRSNGYSASLTITVR